MLVWAMRTRTALRAVPGLAAVCLRNYLASAEVVDANSASKDGASSDSRRPNAVSAERLEGRQIDKLTDAQGADHSSHDGPPTDSGSKATTGGKARQRISTPGPDSSSDGSVDAQVCPGAEPWRT
jgi:hypothetical protein